MADLRDAIMEALAGGVDYVLAYLEDSKTGRVAPAKVRTAGKTSVASLTGAVATTW